MTGHRRALLAAATLIAGSLGGWFALQRGAPAATLRRPGANVLLITIDTLRADASGAYGNARANTPWIDRLAAAGARFDQARAHNVVTLPSHANILSGVLPIHHGVHDNSGFSFPATRETLATTLKSRGYSTAAFISAYPLHSRFGLNRGFDVYDDDFLDAAPGQQFLIQERAATATAGRASRWIAAARQPWFVWVHLYEPHYPYAPPAAIAARFQGREYDGEVAATDAALAPLLQPVLEERGKQQTLVVLTSDHGESLGEHGESTHGIFAYESTLHVPLIVHVGARPGRVVADAAGHVDVLPTILDALGLDVPAGLDGHSLLPQIEGHARQDVPLYFEALSGTLNRGWAPLRGVIRQRVKYVDLPIPELYDLAADPREARNLAETQPERVRELRTLLESARLQEVDSARRPESAEARRRLASLGYVAGAGGAARRYTEADDPKRLIALDAALQQIISLYAQGNLEAAVARCRDLIRERPSMGVSLLYLAQLERERGNLAAAIDALHDALRLNSGEATTAALLAAYLTQAGRADEALRVLDSLEGVADDDQVIGTRALALASLRRFRAAVELLERGARQDPSNAKLLIDLGTVQLMAGNRTEAQRAFERAVQANPDAARAHSSLGAIAVERGNPEAAVAHWRRAVELDPREYDKLLALGLAFARARRPEAARPYLEFFVASAPPSAYAGEIAKARQWLSNAGR